MPTLTQKFGEGGLSQLKRAVQRFRRELLELSELESEPRQVIQVNFQLFPLTTLEEEAE